MAVLTAKHIERLKAGETIKLRPTGNSMKGKIESGQLCTIEPADAASVKPGDAVFCRVNGHLYVHLVQAIEGSAAKGNVRCKIGNNKGHTNGWTAAIYGRVVKVED